MLKKGKLYMFSLNEFMSFAVSEMGPYMRFLPTHAWNTFKSVNCEKSTSTIIFLFCQCPLFHVA